MFTVAWMQRNNEQVPLLSAGVSTRRIVLPVLLCAFFMLGLTVLNQELLIPRIADKLAAGQRRSGRPEERAGAMPPTRPTASTLTGDKASRQRPDGEQPSRCTIPETLGGHADPSDGPGGPLCPGPGRVRAAGSWSARAPMEVGSIPGILDQKRHRPLFPAHARGRFRGGDAQPQLVLHGLDLAALRGTAEPGIDAAGVDGRAVSHSG